MITINVTGMSLIPIGTILQHLAISNDRVAGCIYAIFPSSMM